MAVLFLVLNCGGATLKFKLIDMPDEQVIANGMVDRLGTPKAAFRYQIDGSDPRVVECPDHDHLAGMTLILETLADPQTGIIEQLSEIGAVAHKLAHGGPYFEGPVRIDESVIRALGEMAPLVPLHNPPNLKGIEVIKKLLPGTPQFGSFETSFHRTVPEYAWRYGVPRDWHETLHVRKYGFHSASHRYVASRIQELMEESSGSSVGSRIISCHLGSGTSVCAIRDGQSLDISSGLTPQSGTLMSTRPGDFDPFAITYVMRRRGLSADEMDRILTREGGLLAISGASADMRDVEARAVDGDENARLAIDAFCYQVRRYIGAFVVELGGLAALAFTGGIGENSPLIRSKVCDPLRCLGVQLDEAANNSRGKEHLISTADSRVSVFVVITDEELVVARDAYEVFVSGRANRDW